MIQGWVSGVVSGVIEIEYEGPRRVSEVGSVTV